VTRRAPPGGETVALTIDSIGARGDGIAALGQDRVYIPFTVPGDRVRARLERERGDGRAAELVEIVAPGPGRAAPPCCHFGTCGGCALQHLDPALYAATKTAEIRTALARHGLRDAPIAPLLVLPPGTRRRVRFSLRRRGAAAQVGFNRRESHDLVDIMQCQVIEPRLLALVAPLRILARDVLPPGGAGHATLQGVDTGIDALLDLPAVPDLAGLESLAAFAERHDLARLSWRVAGSGDITPAAQRRPVRIVFAGTAVDLPEDAFLQATPEGEAALTASVLDFATGSRRIADLFGGVGTFSFALAQVARVHTVEGWARASAAVAAAARRAGISDRVTVETRDLQHRPLQVDELATYDAVVFDPPRVGAAPQATTLGASRVPRIISVSCNPASFARDARILLAGGYRLVGVRPLDQFVWSPHIELVAGFTRD
jgi:23S rRNA (uracil1939-C5)-methyltransferase